MKFIVSLFIALSGFASVKGSEPVGYPDRPFRTDDLEAAPVPIPSCAEPCISDAVKKSTNCEESDVPCVCSNIQVISSTAASCVLKACGLFVALAEVRPAGLAMCGQTA